MIKTNRTNRKTVNRKLVALAMAVVLAGTLFLSLNLASAYPTGSDTSGTWYTPNSSPSLHIDDSGPSLDLRCSNQDGAWTVIWRVSNGHLNMGYGHFVQFEYASASDTQLGWFYISPTYSYTSEPNSGFYMRLQVSAYDSYVGWQVSDNTYGVTTVWADYDAKNDHYINGTWFFWYDSGAFSKSMKLYYIEDGTSTAVLKNTLDSSDGAYATHWLGEMIAHENDLHAYAGASTYGLQNKTRYFSSFANDYREPTNGLSPWYIYSGDWVIDGNGYLVEDGSYDGIVQIVNGSSYNQAEMTVVMKGTAYIQFARYSLNTYISVSLGGSILSLHQFEYGNMLSDIDVQTVFNSTVAHTFHIDWSGNYINVYVDNTAVIYADSEWFDNHVGTVALRFYGYSDAVFESLNIDSTNIPFV